MCLSFSWLTGEYKVTEWRLSVFMEWWHFVLWILLFKSYTHALQSDLYGSNLTFPSIYSLTKQDIINLTYILIVTHVWSAKTRNIWHPRVFALNSCHYLINIFYAFSQIWDVFLCILILLINMNKLNPDFNKISEKCLMFVLAALIENLLIPISPSDNHG